MRDALSLNHCTRGYTDGERDPGTRYRKFADFILLGATGARDLQHFRDHVLAQILISAPMSLLLKMRIRAASGATYHEFLIVVVIGKSSRIKKSLIIL